MTASPQLSRRALGRLFGTGFAAAGLAPVLVPSAARARPAAGGIVRLSANENPYGPSPAALQAMRDSLALVSRYPDEAVQAMKADLASLHGVGPEWVILGDGSSEILKLAASAFTGPSAKLAMAEPTFEAIAAHARTRGAEVVTVPLDPAFAHDLEKMAAAGAGLVYVCNPNNPTASITPKARLRAFLEAVPASTAVLVDEAYHHYADGPDYESVLPLVKAHPNLIVARTFSKIYAMAGLRIGYAVAQPAAVQKLAAQSSWDSVNVVALSAARASLRDEAFAAEGRRRNSATRARAVAELDRRGYRVVPSQANFILIELHKEVKPVIASLRDQGVQVGRFFPAVPRHLRVTLGTPAEMERFFQAFDVVMS
jgi:histidinol-phosphate aminotransferase